MNNEIHEEMHNRRSEVLNKLNTIVHSSHVEDFAKILHYTWQENLPEADTIADKLNLHPIDFSSLSLNEEEFKEFFLKELEEELEEQQYWSQWLENYG